MPDYKVNFRDSEAFVTDGAGEVCASSFAVYPFDLSGSGIIGGWVNDSGDKSRDRDSGVDRRLAGIHFDDTGGPTRYFRLDIAAGTYELRLAVGDFNGAVGTQCQVLDTTTVVASLANHALGGSEWYDANDAGPYTPATWASGNTSKQVTFTTTQLRIYLGTGVANAGISHLSLVSVSSGLRWMPRQQIARARAWGAVPSGMTSPDR